MPTQQLMEFLDKNNVKYVKIRHSRAYTAQEIAASAHVPGKELAKTVMVKLDGDLAMAVAPAMCQIDLTLLKQVSGAREAEIADESEFQDVFPGCEVGGMPPFGNLYDLKVYVADRLAEDEEIAFNAGNHTELIRMSYKDFERLAKPEVGHICK